MGINVNFGDHELDAQSDGKSATKDFDVGFLESDDEELKDQDQFKG